MLEFKKFMGDGDANHDGKLQKDELKKLIMKAIKVKNP